MDCTSSFSLPFTNTFRIDPNEKRLSRKKTKKNGWIILISSSHIIYSSPNMIRPLIKCLFTVISIKKHAKDQIISYLDCNREAKRIHVENDD